MTTRERVVGESLEVSASLMFKIRIAEIVFGRTFLVEVFGLFV